MHLNDRYVHPNGRYVHLNDWYARLNDRYVRLNDWYVRLNDWYAHPNDRYVHPNGRYARANRRAEWPAKARLDRKARGFNRERLTGLTGRREADRRPAPTQQGRVGHHTLLGREPVAVVALLISKG